MVRVIPLDGPLGGDRQGILDVFEPLGVVAEDMASPVNMVALDIGPAAVGGEVAACHRRIRRSLVL